MKYSPAIGAVEADEGGRSGGVASSGLDDLEYCAEATRPAISCRAERVAIRVRDQAPRRVRAIRAVEADHRC